MLRIVARPQSEYEIASGGSRGQLIDGQKRNERNEREMKRNERDGREMKDTVRKIGKRETDETDMDDAH